MAAGARQPTSEQRRRGKASSAIDHSQPLRAGREIAAGLRLIRPLGARQTVWLAHDESGRPSAVKTGPTAVIEHEARVLTGLLHPHIVRCERVVRGEFGPVLVMEYLAGGDLVSLAGAAPAHWLEALAAIVDGLAHVHGKGFVHRDLKARNVLLAGDDSVRLIDFGSALRIGSPWTAGGTTVVAPDRGTGPVAAADDVHALAALAHELIHGVPPGRGRSPGRAAAAEPLSGTVDACLGSYAGAETVGFEGFRTVIESMRQQGLGQR